MNGQIMINIWINEERFEKMREAGLSGMAQDMLAGMKVTRVKVSEKQKDILLSEFPMAKFDSSTTGTIELLPRKVKDEIFNLCLEKKSTGEDVIEAFILRVRNGRT